MAAKKSATKKPAAKKASAKKPAKKSAAKKRTARKVAKAAKTAKKAVKAVKAKAAPKAKKIALVKDKAFTKSQLYSAIAEFTGVSKKQVNAVFDAFTDILHAHLKKGAIGQFKLAGLVNAKVVNKPARKARKGINPFTGEEIMIKARPAYKVVKVSALKQLKGMAN